MATTYPPFEQFAAKKPTFLDFLNRGESKYRDYSAGGPYTLSKIGTQTGVDLGTGLTTLGLPAEHLGFAALAKMLSDQGRIDPAAMNLRIQDIARGTQGAQSQTAGTLASRGLSRSGLGLALMGAQGQAGENRIAQTRAAEDQAAYQRQQQNLQLLKDLIIGPETDLAAIGAGQYGGQQQAKAAKQSAIIGAIGAILGGIAGRK